MCRAQIPFYVLVGWKKHGEPQKKDGKDNLKISRSISRTKTQLDSTEKLLNSRKNPKIFNIVCSSRDPERLGGEEHPTRELRGPDHLHSCPRSMTFCGKQMVRVASRTLRKSGIVRRNSYQDIWTFLGPVSEKRWYGSSHDGQWDRTANEKVQQFKETGLLIFISTSALSRGILKR